MPATTSLDRITATGILRTCRTCRVEQPLDHTHFWQARHTSLNPGDHERTCRNCGRARQRATRARRGSGTGRRFGVEIEFIGSRRDLEREMRARGLRAEEQSYNHRVQSQWKIVPDASVMGGGELVSPPLSGAAGIEQVRLACEALAAAGATVNRSTGLHVHHEITDLNGAAVKRLARGWRNSQQAINMLVAPSRRNGNYCRNLTDREMELISEIPDAADQDGIRRHLSYLDRFRAMNLAGYPRYGTVEIRQHQGTTNADKIVAWIKFGQAMVQRAKDADAGTAQTTITELLAQLASHGLPRDTAAYLARRADRLAPNRQPAMA